MQLEYPQQGRFASSHIDINQDGLPDFIVETNLWNIESSSGFVQMKSNPNTLLDVQIDLKNVVQINPRRWVHAYPEIWCGAKPWNKLGPTNHGRINLPGKLSQLMDFSTTVDYTVTRIDPQLPYNFAFETWLTKSTNRTGVSAGEVEIMIWFTHANLQAAGSKIAELEIPVTLNGTERTLAFSLFRADMDWEYFAFVTKEPVEKGKITFNWSPFLKKAKAFSKITEWNELYFTVIEVGTEFGAPGYSSAKLSWSLKELYFQSLDLPICGD
ncbi:MAG: GH12 family glycosyl hydrolase domain-containing protein [Pseudothermotoga sp.]